MPPTKTKTPLKLVNTYSNDVVAEVYEDHIVFLNKDLEMELKISGISIPYFLSSQFNGKRIIEFKDKLFHKAFIEVQCQIWMREAGFTLT